MPALWERYEINNGYDQVYDWVEDRISYHWPVSTEAPFWDRKSSKKQWADRADLQALAAALRADAAKFSRNALGEALETMAEIAERTCGPEYNDDEATSTISDMIALMMQDLEGQHEAIFDYLDWDS